MSTFKVRDIDHFRRSDRSIHARVALSLFFVALLVSCGGEEGKQGVSGTQGNVGTPGQAGFSSLVLQTPLEQGSPECPAGGLRVQSGLDSNFDTVLSEGEISDENVVCNGTELRNLDPALVAEGRDIFRFDHFGSDQLWTGTLGLHEVIEALVSPNVALSVGLKVDSDALPEGILDSADLDSPATTLALISLDAVVGINGTVEDIDGELRLTSFGITCALCHSDVDNSVADGIGKRLDGWAARDINPGAILALSPALQDSAVQEVLNSWGPGKYDAYWNQDGINDPTVIPPAYGFNGVHRATYTGEGSISYWNAYVAITQMGGQGNFRDDDLNVNIELGDGIEDLVSPKLDALREYQLSLSPPQPPEASFDAVAAGRGKFLFENAAKCSTCHSGSQFTDANFKLHSAEEVGTDSLLASRSKTGMYRTTPLRGLWQRAPYFHNGSAESLSEVVSHYDQHLTLSLSTLEQSDLVEYLKSL